MTDLQETVVSMVNTMHDGHVMNDEQHAAAVALAEESEVAAMELLDLLVG